MQTFDQSAVSTAPPEEVWKLLYDPAQFPLWWAGTGSVEPAGDVGDYTMYPEGYPDFPMPQALTTSRENGAVKISCLVSDLSLTGGCGPREAVPRSPCTSRSPTTRPTVSIPSVRSSADQSGSWPSSPPLPGGALCC